MWFLFFIPSAFSNSVSKGVRCSKQLHVDCLQTNHTHGCSMWNCCRLSCGCELNASVLFRAQHPHTWTRWRRFMSLLVHYNLLMSVHFSVALCPPVSSLSEGTSHRTEFSLQSQHTKTSSRQHRPLWHTAGLRSSAKPSAIMLLELLLHLLSLSFYLILTSLRTNIRSVLCHQTLCRFESHTSVLWNKVSHYRGTALHTLFIIQPKLPHSSQVLAYICTFSAKNSSEDQQIPTTHTHTHTHTHSLSDSLNNLF